MRNTSRDVAGSGERGTTDSNTACGDGMSGADSETVQFVGLNIIVIAVVLLFLFGYLVLLIRKRWKANFLHPVDPKKQQGKGNT